MIGFAVSTVAVILAAWFGYVAGRTGHRAAHLNGIYAANQQWRRELDDAHSDDPRVRYIAARFSAGVVPAGTPRRPHDLDANGNCPECVEQGRRAAVARTIRDDPGHSIMCDCGECLRVFGG